MAFEAFTNEGGSSLYYKFEDGENRLRVLVDPIPLVYHITGEGRWTPCAGQDVGCVVCGAEREGGEQTRRVKRGVTIVIDRKDGEIKFAELPLSVVLSMKALYESSDYAFDSFPAPYDIVVKHDPNHKDPRQKYVTLPGKESPVTEEEMEKFQEFLAAHGSADAYVQRVMGRKGVALEDNF